MRWLLILIAASMLAGCITRSTTIGPDGQKYHKYEVDPDWGDKDSSRDYGRTGQ